MIISGSAMAVTWSEDHVAAYDVNGARAVLAPCYTCLKNPARQRSSCMSPKKCATILLAVHVVTTKRS